MGRAIVRQPQVFLMDEPLSNLDAKLRVQTRTQIASLQRRLGVTTVYVTHDQIEAMTMGDRIAVLKDGLLQQVGTPRDLYDTPEQRVRRRLHRLPGDEPDPGATVAEGGVQFGDDVVPVDRETARQGQRQAGHRRRPPRGRRGRRPTATASRSIVDLVEELGADGYVYGTPASDRQLEGGDDGLAEPIVARVDGRKVTRQAGDRSTSTPTPSHMHVFDLEPGERLG